MHTPATHEALSMAPRERSVGGNDVDRVLDVVCLYSVGVLGAGKVQGPSAQALWFSPVQQLYYQNFLHLSPLHTFLRFLPMFISGTICNVIVAAVISRVPILYLIGLSVFSFQFSRDELNNNHSNRHNRVFARLSLVRGHHPKCAILGFWIPGGYRGCDRRRLRLCGRDAVRRICRRAG